ncbi:MAG: hypothetical protein ACKKL5_04285 [Candidatus Komeilibacteria bacterium]
MKKSSMFISVFIIILFVGSMVVTSCDNPVEPIDNPPEALGKLILVPLGNEALSKVFIGEDGNKYLPPEAAENNLKKMDRLAKIASEVMINFGEMPSTRTLMYVIMNVGDKPVFDVTFDANNNLMIVPHTVGFIQVSVSGTEVAAYPIISITKEHVLPISGVGQLLEMNLGVFIDTLNLIYHYNQGQDTIEVVDPYRYEGALLGIDIDIICSGQPILNYAPITRFGNNPLEDPQPLNGELVEVSSLEAFAIDTTLVINNGNVSSRVRVSDYWGIVTLLDSTIAGGDTLDVSNYFDDSWEAFEATNGMGNCIRVGPSNYIINMVGYTNLTGYVGFVATP